MGRPAVPRRKPIVKQVTDDIIQGGKTLLEEGKQAAEKVKEGVRRVKKHLGG